MSKRRRYLSNGLHLSAISGRLFTALVAIGLVVFGLLPGRVAYAFAFAVNTTSDTADFNPGDGICSDANSGGQCSLRAAIMEANAWTGPDTITVPAGTYTLSIPGTGENASATGDLDITGDLTINGAGASATIVNANGIDRVFNVLSNASATFNGIKITGGSIGGSGGGIYNQATTTINDSIVTNNTTTRYQSGGGIANTGNLTVNNSAISNNTAANIGGGIYGTFGTTTINNSAIVNNISNGENGGGGLYNSYSATSMFVNNSTVSGNTAQNVGGGIFNSGALTLKNNTIAYNTADSDNNSSGAGGGIFSNAGTVTIQNTIIANNIQRYHHSRRLLCRRRPYH